MFFLSTLAHNITSLANLFREPQTSETNVAKDLVCSESRLHPACVNIRHLRFHRDEFIHSPFLPSSAT